MKRMEIVKSLWICGVIVAFAAGCASPPPDVSTYYDQVSGQRTDLMAENELEAPGNPREIVWLNASRVFRDYNTSDYYLEVSYMAMAERGYLDIPPGQTLTLIVDGQPMNFDGSGSLNTRKPYKKDFVRENAIYPITKSQLQKIAAAK